MDLEAEARQAYTLAAEILDLPRAPLARVEDVRVPAADGTLLEDAEDPVDPNADDTVPTPAPGRRR